MIFAARCISCGEVKILNLNEFEFLGYQKKEGTRLHYIEENADCCQNPNYIWKANSSEC